MSASTKKDNPLCQAGYPQLQQRIRSGQAVFFFGAGMSIDGEGNTAARMLSRLVLRFWVLSDYCIERKLGGGRARRLRKDFLVTFQIPKLNRKKVRRRERDKSELELKSLKLVRKRLHEFYHWKLLSILCERYYDFNDWICAAFDGLLSDLAEDAEFGWQEILKKEKRFFERMAPKDLVPPEKIDESLIKWAAQCSHTPEHLAGKTLFLDTMGFSKMPDLMGGKSGPEMKLKEVAASYRGKLQERHFVIARFAREGWAPLILTTNFDRLLEGAFRLSGFRPASETTTPLPPLPVPTWETIAEARQFFDVGGKSQTALIVKIHGCAETYESLRSPNDKKPDPKNWEAYLKAMVFTFREIQNWREDAWSRDFLRTLLRTRAMIFCGYSTRDPVIHDTLRSVYEEMTASRPLESETDRKLEEAPAFFLAGGPDERDFHGIEVLRAASSAISGKGMARSATHPNYLRHQFRQTARKKKRLPDTDDVFLWTYHLAYRAYQAECLENELRGLASQLKAKKGLIDDIGIARIMESFQDLREKEESDMRRLPDDASGHEKFRRGLRWTEGFHPQLLREFACAEATRMGSSQREWLREMRASRHYYVPASARPGWTAWAVVVELAIRGAAKRANFDCGVGLADRPTLLLTRREQTGRLPSELLIHHVGISKRSSPPRARGATLYQCVWELGAADYPWPLEDESEDGENRKSLVQERPYHRAKGPAPTAQEIWKWAASEASESREHERKCLGIEKQKNLKGS